MPDEPGIPIEAAEKALSFAEERGLARGKLLGAAKVEYQPNIPLRGLCRIYEEAACLTADDSFGLHVGERTSPRMYGLLGYVAANSPTFEDALESLLQFQPLWTEAAGLELRRGRGTIALTYWHKGNIPAARRRHEHEQMLCALLGFARETVSQEVRPVEVRFEHEAPADLREHKRIFAARLVFGAPATELVLPASLLAIKLSDADLTLGSLVRRQAEAAVTERGKNVPLLEQLRADLRRRFLTGERPSLAASAAALGVGARTLQRRLREERRTFRDLTEENRIELARKMLADPRIGISEIAFLLGYSQSSAFHRAFRQATETTPRRFRLKVRGEPPPK